MRETLVLNKTARKIIGCVFWTFHRSTSCFRPLPDFIIIGAQKAGTTSLFYYLSQHPLIQASFKKEIGFFSHHYEKGLQWYRAHFPIMKSSKHITGEATTLYLFDTLVPERIYDTIPNAKLIVILRNPVERALSHYFHAVRLNKEHLPLMEALLTEEDRMQNLKDVKNAQNAVHAHASYKKKGIYSEQIERFLYKFPKEQMLFLKSEGFFSQTKETLQMVFRFLEIDENCEVKDLKPRNIGENRLTVEPEVYDYLSEYFSPHNRVLYQLIGQDFDW